MRRAGSLILALTLAATPALAHTTKHHTTKHHTKTHAADNIFKLDSVVMYQPASVVADRVADPAALTAYEHSLEHDLRATLEAAPSGPGFNAALVVAVRPTQRAKPGAEPAHVWLMTKADVSPDLTAQLTAAAQSEPAPDVQGAAIAFAVVFDGFGGGGPKVVDKQHPVPIPPEWTAAAPLAAAAPADSFSLAR